ncbi:MAG: hypothetical protein ABMB14_01485 [Myxococcota bacterium]
MTRRYFTGAGLGITLLLAAAVVSPRAVATTFAPLTIEQFTDASTYIVEGRVQEVWTDLDAATGMVWTRARVQVTVTHKGPDQPTELTVDSPGGDWGDYQVFVPGMASYSLGEDVFLFLDHTDSGRYVSVSKFEGKYTIRTAPGEVRPHVMTWQTSRDVPFDARFLPHPPADARVYLDDLRERVQDRLDIGWDGKPIPAIPLEKLQQVNTLDRRLPR